MADTPRDPPGLNEQWSDEISALLSQWGEVSLCYSWLHNYSQRKYKRKYHHMSIPIIVLSTLTGTANFADSYVPDGFKQGFSACVGGLNIFCGILGTLMSFLKYAEVYEAHRIAAVAARDRAQIRNQAIRLKARRRAFIAASVRKCHAAELHAHRHDIKARRATHLLAAGGATAVAGAGHRLGRLGHPGIPGSP